MMTTPICKRLGIRFPVFQAGMGRVARGELVAKEVIMDVVQEATQALERLAAIPR